MFTYNDIVLVKSNAPSEMRPGQKAWVIGVITEDERDGLLIDWFPTGTVYTVEFEGGDALDIHESLLEHPTA